MAKTGKPNILFIMADDIGWFNLSCYNHGLMGYRTPNMDRIAREGAMFTDFYGQQSCTAGRAAFLTGQQPIRTGLTKVGMPGAALGIKAEDVTIAQVLKGLGYATGQFGRTILAIATSTCRRCMASMSSSGICITSTPRKQRFRIVFAEQIATGLEVWRAPLKQMRIPKLFDLRSDPFEAGEDSIRYNDGSSSMSRSSTPRRRSCTSGSRASRSFHRDKRRRASQSIKLSRS